MSLLLYVISGASSSDASTSSVLAGAESGQTDGLESSPDASTSSALAGAEFGPTYGLGPTFASAAATLETPGKQKHDL